MYKQNDQQAKGSIILLTGPPGTGKSYFFKQIKNDCEQNAKVYYIELDQVEQYCNNYLLINKKVESFSEQQDDIQHQQTQNGLQQIEKQKDQIIQELLNILVLESCVQNKFSQIKFQQQQQNFNNNENEQNDQIDEKKQFNNIIWKYSRDLSRQLLICLINYCKAAENQNDRQQYIIFVDDDFLLQSMRKKYYDIAFHNELNFLEIFLENTLENCLLQNKQRQGIKKLEDDNQKKKQANQLQIKKEYQQLLDNKQNQFTFFFQNIGTLSFNSSFERILQQFSQICNFKDQIV
ncbi:P-loop containing nucleoside triphosphate hydrolase [Pseudocohnilembus persalinus]|uniref:p-loop containing nucleoside triphosphate hydrolase n=1 Tax=Pseudocohnilembus persalinus TaxID=266149 RepID=A0A0V0QXQ6_PSEPJ|nr:P-loop containing nucleoside triphosphate hydrolase [Pseudocohnilembus persalinus]|eukprot:KRX07014.1 P-loop containing nucleoside triphosphate hydrolase [Pseudocohnilembus persalinus]